MKHSKGNIIGILIILIGILLNFLLNFYFLNYGSMILTQALIITIIIAGSIIYLKSDKKVKKPLFVSGILLAFLFVEFYSLAIYDPCCFAAASKYAVYEEQYGFDLGYMLTAFTFLIGAVMSFYLSYKMK